MVTEFISPSMFQRHKEPILENVHFCIPPKHDNISNNCPKMKKFEMSLFCKITQTLQY